MRVAIGADHGGLPLKDDIMEVLEADGHEVLDLGAYEFDPDDDYPDLTAPVARAVSSGKADRGRCGGCARLSVIRSCGCVACGLDRSRMRG